VQLPGERPQERPTVVVERGREPRGGVERVGEAEELGGFQPASPDGPFDGGPDVLGRPDADSGPLGEKGSRLIGLVQAPRDDDRVRAGLEGLCQTTAGAELRVAREALADRRVLQDGEGATIHRSGSPAPRCGGRPGH
jgi:hypothetical protein